MPSQSQPAAAPHFRKLVAALFAAAGLAALLVSAYLGRQRYLREHPPPLPNVIAPIPENLQQGLRLGLNLLGAALGLSAAQQTQLNEVWNPLPRSLDEVVERQRRTARILTPEQLSKFNTHRERFQNRIVDQMIAPARQRMSPDDFSKFDKEIKRRVKQRMDAPQ